MLMGLSLLKWRNVCTTNKIIVLGGTWILAVALTSSLAFVYGPGKVHSLENADIQFEDNAFFIPHRNYEKTPNNASSSQSIGDDVPFTEFAHGLETEVQTKLGQPIEGYEPVMFLQVFPGLIPEDFDGAEATIGHYTFTSGTLEHDLENAEMVHSAAPALTDDGMKTLYKNVAKRLEKNDVTYDGNTELLELLRISKIE